MGGGSIQHDRCFLYSLYMAAMEGLQTTQAPWRQSIIHTEVGTEGMMMVMMMMMAMVMMAIMLRRVVVMMVMVGSMIMNANVL